MLLQQFCAVIIVAITFSSPSFCRQDRVSVVGDPGMRRDDLRIEIEAWNQCNEVGEEAPNMGSPREADCFDIDNSTTPSEFLLLLTPYIFSASYLILNYDELN